MPLFQLLVIKGKYALKFAEKALLLYFCYQEIVSK